MIRPKAITAYVLIILLSGCIDKKDSQLATLYLEDSFLGSDTVHVISYNLLDYSEKRIETVHKSNQKPIQLDLPTPKFITLKIDNEYHQIYLEQGYKMTVDINAQNTSRLIFKGKGSSINNYISYSSRILKEFYRSKQAWFRLEKSKFLQAIDTLQIEFEVFDKAYVD